MAHAFRVGTRGSEHGGSANGVADRYEPIAHVRQAPAALRDVDAGRGRSRQVPRDLMRAFGVAPLMSAMRNEQTPTRARAEGGGWTSARPPLWVKRRRELLLFAVVKRPFVVCGSPKAAARRPQRFQRQQLDNVTVHHVNAVVPRHDCAGTAEYRRSR